MDKNFIQQLYIDIDAGTISIGLFALAIFLSLVYFIKTAAKQHIAKIISIKKAKDLLITQVTESLMQLHTINSKLINQKEVLDSYDNASINEAMELVTNIRSKYGILNYIDNPQLVKGIVFYFDGKTKLLEEMLMLERDSYDFQLLYHQKVLQFDREMEQLKSKDGTNSEDILEYKRYILTELEKIRTKVSTTLSGIREKRNEYYTELMTSQNMANELLEKLGIYRDKQLKMKKFYPKYLAFA